MMGIEFRDILLALALLGQIANAAWLYIERRNDKTNERINNQAERMDMIEKDLSGLIATSKGAPTHHDLANVYNAQNRTDEKLNQLIGETRSQSDLLRLIMAQITKKGME